MATNQAERRAQFNRRKRGGKKVVVSEGDSWFSYEFFPNIIDLINDMEKFAHLRLEMSGDTVENMIGTDEQLEVLREVVQEESALFLLFSGGGNDIQKASDDGLFQNEEEPADCIVEAKGDALFGMVRDRYEALIQAVGPAVPIAGHGYDRFQPTDEPVRLLGLDIGIGPWIHPNMVAAGINDPEKQKAIADVLIDRLNEDLASLQDAYPDDFVFMDLRDILEPVEEWENEIHPTREGFRKVTDKIWDEIDTRVRELVRRRSWED